MTYTTLKQAIEALGEDVVLHHVNQFVKDYARRRAINKRLRTQQRDDARAYRELMSRDENKTA